MIRSTVFVLAAMGLAGAAFGQVSYVGGLHTENFDSITSATSPFSATIGAQAAIPGLATWRGAKIAGTGTGNMPWTTNDGGSSTGGLFDYGVSASTDRALGALASGSNTGAFGVEIVNNGSDAISEFTIVFDGEQYRSSTSATGTPNRLTFAWGVSGGSVLSTDFLSNAGMTADATGDIVGDTPVPANGIMSPPLTLGPYSVTVTGLNVLVGESIFLRWQDFNDQGNDAGLAIDNFGFRAVFVPAPGAAALFGIGALIAARRRR